MAWFARRAKFSLFNRSYSSSAPGTFAGIQGLSEPEQWSTLARNAAEKCRALVDQIVLTPPSASTIQLLDEISDTICQVVDAAEFCRNVHSQPEWRVAAQQVCVDLGAYVHDLNTNFTLYTSLKRALDTLEQDKNGANDNNNQNDKETMLVGKLLLRDFERSGVHLSGSLRDRMTQLMSHTQSLGFAFTHNITDPTSCGEFVVRGSDALSIQNDLSPATRRMFRPYHPHPSRRDGDGGVDALAAPATSPLLLSVIASSESPTLRKHAYTVYNSTPVQNLRILDELVAARHEIATIMGYPSYAAYQLDGFSLAHTPGAVNEFLDSLSKAIRPAADREVGRLVRAMDEALGRGSASRSPEHGIGLSPWDKDWAMRAAGRGGPLDLIAHLSHYFTVEKALDGLSFVSSKVLGVDIFEEECPDGEAWAPGVRKLLVKDRTDGTVLGTVYLDLYRRPHKFPGAAHFVLRCGRQHPRVGDAGVRYQRPVVALVANFRGSDGQQHLTLHDVQTLFHEFGHAMNSVLSKTRYQHLSGTRGPQDIIEIPSHVFERFASDPLVLSHLTSSPLPSSLVAAVQRAPQEFAALTLQSTLRMCAIDQLLHSASPPVGSDAERQITDIAQQYSALGPVPGTRPHIRLNHVIGYGANYYCYLFAQCISAHVWLGPSGHATWPAEGVLRQKLLEPGGATPAKDYVSGLVGEDALIHVASSSRGTALQNEIRQKQKGWYPRIDSLLQYLNIAVV